MSEEKTADANLLALMSALDISEVEAKVLVQVYSGGYLTAGATALLIGEKQPKVEKALESLTEKGLVGRQEGLVPVYRVLMPVAAVSSRLTSLLENLRGLAETTDASVAEQAALLQSASDETNALRKTSIESLRTALDANDASTAKLLQEGMNNVAGVATAALSGFSDAMESILKAAGTEFEEKTGADSASLQAELESLQERLATEMAKASREFQASLKEIHTTSNSALKEFDKSAAELMQKTRRSVKDTVETMGVVLQDVWADLTKDVETLTSESVTRATPALDGISDEISVLVGGLKATIEQSYTRAMAELAGVLDKTRGVFQQQAEETQGLFQSAIEAAAASHEDVDSWTHEAGGYLNSASQFIKQQFDRVAQLDQSYHDSILASLTTELDKASTLLEDDYRALKDTANTIQEDFESYITESKTSTISTIQAQNTADQTRSDTAKETLSAELDKWSKSASRGINKILSAAETETQGVLETEAAEIGTAAENMSSRLKSSFGTAVSASSAKSDTAFSGVKKSAKALDTAVSSKIEELLSDYETKTTASLQETKATYEELSTQLNERLTQSMTAVSSQIDRSQKAVETSIADQIERIDKQSESIRLDFHAHVEDMTKQFITMAQGLETSFNSMLAGQTLETRDTIASLHSEFRNTLKNEMKTLKEDSAQLQQEYASQIAEKLEAMEASVLQTKQELEALLSEKHGEMSVTIEDAIGKMDAVLKSIYDSLKDLESGTVAELADGFVGVSKEMQTSLGNTQASLKMSFDAARESVDSSLRKNVGSVESLAGSFIADETSAKQRTLADVSKRLDSLAAKAMKSSESKVESYRTALANREVEGVASKTKLVEEAAALVASKRAESAQSIGDTSAWFDTSLTNLSTALTGIGDKLNADLDVLYKGLAKTSNDIAKSITVSGDKNAEVVEEIVNSMLTQLQTSLTGGVTTLGEKGTTEVDQALRAIVTLEKSIADTMADLGISVGSKANDRQNEVLDRLETGLKDYKTSVSSSVATIGESLEQTEKGVVAARDALLERADRAVADGSSLTSSAYETATLALKTRLSSDTYSLTESVHDEAAKHSTAIGESVIATSNSISGEASKLKQIRNDAISSFETSAEKRSKKWVSDARTSLDGVRSQVSKSTSEVDSAVVQTANALDSLKKSSESLAHVPSEKTWYLVGVEEMKAYIMDMASRAEKSIVISVADLAMLDLKKLAKLKATDRRILIVPKKEEPDSQLELLAGWRIWEDTAPPILAVCDGKEILLGGSELSEKPIAVVSIDHSYLKLYHDVIGPRLVKGRKD